MKGLRIGVQTATTGADFVTGKLKPQPEVKQFPDTPSMFAALAANQIDAAMTDTAIVLARPPPPTAAQTWSGQYATGETYGALYPKGSANEATLDKIIQAMIDDGTLKQALGQISGRGLGQPIRRRFPTSSREPTDAERRRRADTPVRLGGR